MEQTSDISSSPGTPSSGSLEKDRLLLEDPRWNGKIFMFILVQNLCLGLLC